MKEKLLVIGDDDKAYIDRLGRYISTKGESKIKVACFSDRKLFISYAKDHPVDMFLTGGEWIDENVCADQRRWLRLVDSEEENVDGGNYRTVRRYQAADELMTKVIQCMDLPGAKTSEKHGNTSRLGVYSPGGWVENTRLAMALAAVMGKEGPAVYVGLNEFSPIMKLTGKCKGYDLSDVAYAWRRGRLNYGQMEQMTSHLDGFDGIPAPVNPAELAELSGVELEELLEKIHIIGGYRNMVVDFGGSISGRHSLFEHCGRNLVIFPGTEAGLYQQEEFKQFWQSVGAEGVLEKTDCVVLPPEGIVRDRKGKGDDYIDELAERLLRRREDHGTEGGMVIC